MFFSDDTEFENERMTWYLLDRCADAFILSNNCCVANPTALWSVASKPVKTKVIKLTGVITYTHRKLRNVILDNTTLI